MFEKVQKAACIIIKPGLDYSSALADLKLDNLHTRRQQLSYKAAVKMSQNPKYSHLFVKKTGCATRSKSQFVEPKAKTTRFRLSSIPFFIRILNEKIAQNQT